MVSFLLLEKKKFFALATTTHPNNITSQHLHPYNSKKYTKTSITLKKNKSNIPICL